MNSIKVAVVGTGFMGWVHIEALRRLGIGIAGVLGSSPEKTKAFALKTGIAKAYFSYEEVQIPVLVLFISVFPINFIF